MLLMTLFHVKFTAGHIILRTAAFLTVSFHIFLCRETIMLLMTLIHVNLLLVLQATQFSAVWISEFSGILLCCETHKS